MAVFKLLEFGQLSLLRPIAPWNATQRNFSKTRTILESLGYPVKPKRPHTSYIIFVNEKRAELVSQNPSLQIKEVYKELGKLWRQMPESEKKPYVLEAQKLAQDYKLKMEEYNKCLTEEQKQEINEVLTVHNETKKAKSLAHQVREREKELKKPKCPGSPFLIFCAKNLPSYEGCTTEQKLKDLGEKWKNVPESEKEKYKALFLKEKEKYERDLQKWEEQMMKLGNYDLIRLSTLRQKLHTTL